MIIIEVWTQAPNDRSPRRRRTYAVDCIEQLQEGEVWRVVANEAHLVGAYLYQKTDGVPYHDRRMGTITRDAMTLD